MLRVSKTCCLIGIERVLLTLWVGGLWVAGYLVVPTLFAILDDRQLAGRLAGEIFRSMSYVGIAAGIYLLAATAVRAGQAWSGQWRLWVLLTMLLLVAVGGFVLQPMMQELKATGLIAGSAQATQFGRLHGLSSVLFLVTSLLGLVLAGVGLHRPRPDL